VIENVSGIKISVRNAGRASSIFEKLIWLTLWNIAAPTRISTAAVAKGGTIPASGAINKHGRKQSAVTTEVLPVRPPMLIPAMLSIYAVPDEVPARPAPIVASESTINPCRRFRGCPSSSSKSPACATPMNVEIESKRSVNRIAMIDGSKLNFNAPKISSLKNTVPKSGRLNIRGGAVTRPKAQATTVTTTIALRKANGFFRDIRKTEIATPRIVSSAEFWRYIDTQLHCDAERAVVLGSFVLGLKPGEICEQRPDLFANVGDVYNIKRNVLSRLSRNPELRRRLSA